MSIKPSLQGFTLVELVVTVGVAAVLVTTAVPSFITLIKNNQRAAGVNALIVDFNLARSEAVKRGNRVALCRTSQNAAAIPVCGAGEGWEDGWIVFDDEDGNGNPDASLDVLRSHPPVQGEVTVRGNATAANLIPYIASGRMGTVGEALIAWCDDRAEGEQAREITIAPSGRVTVTQGSADCTP